MDWDVWEIAPQSLLCTYLKPTELGVISRDRTRVAEQINPSTIDHRSTRARAGTVSPGQSSAIKQEGARAVIKMTFGRSRPSAQRGLTVSPIRRVAARWSQTSGDTGEEGDRGGSWVRRAGSGDIAGTGHQLEQVLRHSLLMDRSVLLPPIVRFGKHRFQSEQTRCP